jgi:hypothetical protein
MRAQTDHLARGVTSDSVDGAGESIVGLLPSKKRRKGQTDERKKRRDRTHVVRRLPHVRKLVQQIRHLTNVRILRQKAHDPRPIPDQLSISRPRIVSDRHARRGVNVLREARVVVRLGPDGGEDAVAVYGEDRDHFVRVGVEPGLDGGEVGGERSTVEKEAAVGGRG